MNITGKNLIGNSTSGKSSKKFESIGGVVKNVTEKFFEATFDEIDLAVTKAHSAFKSYRNFPGEKKAQFLERIASALNDAKENIIPVTMQETKLAQGRLQGEMQRTINQVKLFADLLREGSWVNAIIDTAQPGRQPLPKPDIRQMQIPLGAVAVFGASNFPLAFSVAGGDTISAFAAGCPVVYKAHPGHPLTSEMVGKIIIDAARDTEMPEGIFSLLQGVDYEISIRLVAHSLIKAVGFTGSFAGGKALFDVAAKREEPIPVYAEMGSINPVFILPEMLQQNGAAVAEKLVASNTLSAGQFCTNPGVIISRESNDTNKFIQHFVSSLNKATAECMLTNKINVSYYTSVKKFSGIAGVDVVTNNVPKENENAATPFMFKTTASNFINNNELFEEVFGPSSLHVVAGNKEELFAVADKLPGQLTITVWGTENDLENYKDLLNVLQLKAGRVICNSVPTGVEVTHAMVHGGPYPATTDSRTTSVGTNAIYRFTRAVCYQGYPHNLLPDALKNENPLKIVRKVNGEITSAALS
jgi:NADP-dependent aldehyde dehydrogenase